MIQEPLILRKKRGMRGSSIRSFPAPLGGWNTRDPLTGMQSVFAVEMENWLPTSDGAATRKGAVAHKTGFTNPILTLIPYTPPEAVKKWWQVFGGTVTDKLFAATSDGIYDVTASGTVGAKVRTITYGYISFAQTTVNGSSTKLFCANGVDDTFSYDGSGWSTFLPGNSKTSIMTAHRGQVWFADRDKLLVKSGQSFGDINLSRVFKLGGRVAGIASWTSQTVSGYKPYLVVLSTEGELALCDVPDTIDFGISAALGNKVYFDNTVQPGTSGEPDFAQAEAREFQTAKDVELAGLYRLNPPLGVSPLIPVENDMFVLTTGGVTRLSEILTASFELTEKQLTHNIEPTYIDYVRQYGDLAGWSGTWFPRDRLFIVNIPTSTTTNIQLVLNMTTGAWTKFTGWNAFCAAHFNDKLYIGTANKVGIAQEGNSDFGSPIVCKLRTAFTNFGTLTQKHIKMLRFMMQLQGLGSGTLSLKTGLDADLENSGTVTTIPLGDASTPGALQRYWQSVYSKSGTTFSLRLEATVRDAGISWTSTDYLVEHGGGVL